MNGTYDGNGKQDFFIPEFGYNKMLNPNLALGVSVFGNGGLNTELRQRDPAVRQSAVFGQQQAGVDLQQLFIAPTVAFKVAPEPLDRRLAEHRLPALQGRRACRTSPRRRRSCSSPPSPAT
ncbi:MAG: hypothetical protein MZV65_48465 [Chromatiales bacterium]|nr:hypothetical protein [Chromatiales bacterium]